MPNLPTRVYFDVRIGTFEKQNCCDLRSEQPSRGDLVMAYSASTNRTIPSDVRGEGHDDPDPVAGYQFGPVPATPPCRMPRAFSQGCADQPLHSGRKRVARSSGTSHSPDDSDGSLSDDFGLELEEVHRRNRKLFETLSQVQSELETLKMSVNSNTTNNSVDYEPGSIMTIVRDLYGAQKQWQNAMSARLTLNESQRDNITCSRCHVTVKGQLRENAQHDHSCSGDQSRPDFNRMRICYSLGKWLFLSETGSGRPPCPAEPSIPDAGTCNPAAVRSASSAFTSPWSSSSSLMTTQERDVSGSAMPDRKRDVIEDDGEDGDLRVALRAAVAARDESEANCRRLERLVVVLRKKLLRCSSCAQ